MVIGHQGPGHPRFLRLKLILLPHGVGPVLLVFLHQRPMAEAFRRQRRLAVFVPVGFLGDEPALRIADGVGGVALPVVDRGLHFIHIFLAEQASFRVPGIVNGSVSRVLRNDAQQLGIQIFVADQVAHFVVAEPGHRIAHGGIGQVVFRIVIGFLRHIAQGIIFGGLPGVSPDRGHRIPGPVVVPHVHFPARQIVLIADLGVLILIGGGCPIRQSI